MDISPEQAKRQLEGASVVVEATRVVAALKGTDLITFAWGAALILGCGWSHMVVNRGWPNNYHVVWWPLLAVAGAVTVLLMRRTTQPVDHPGEGKRLAVLWFSVFFYGFLGMGVLGPFLNHAQLHGTPDGARSLLTLNMLLPLFSFVMMGLLLRQSFFYWMAAPLTVLLMVGHLFFRDLYFLYIMVVFGGTFVGTGLWMRLSWQAAMRKARAHAES